MDIRDKVYRVMGEFGFDRERYQELLASSNELEEDELREFILMLRLQDIAESHLASLGEYMDWQLGQIHKRLKESFPRNPFSRNQYDANVVPLNKGGVRGGMNTQGLSR